MSDYSKITNFLSKDSLALNDPAKYVKGSEIDAEYNAIAVAIATKADTASPTLVTPNIGAATGTSLVLSGLATVNGAFTSLGLDDNATAKALTLSGSGANSVTIANSATTPTIGTTSGNLWLSPAGDLGLEITAIAGSPANYVAIIPSATVDPLVSSNTGGLFLGGTPTAQQVRVVNTGSATRYITLTGAIAGGNPTIGTSAGSLAITPSVIATGYYHAFSGTATTAGGYANPGFYMGNAFMGVFWGSGAPSVSAAKGSLYLRSDGSTTNNRMYVNTDGGTTWTAVTTAA
jgi:hypothetical protein